MKNLPAITYWRERVGHEPGGPTIYAVHAVRNWDVPSNGVFLLYTASELHGNWDSRRDWRKELAEKLGKRERALAAEFGRYLRDHLCDYSADEGWCALDG